MRPGHGITGARLQRLCREGKFRPLGDCVLVEAIMAEDAMPVADDGVRLGEGVTVDARKAVAFRIAAIGKRCPKEDGVNVNDVVMNISISGERVDPEDKACPWWTVRYDHLVGHVEAADAYAEGYLEVVPG